MSNFDTTVTVNLQFDHLRTYKSSEHAFHSAKYLVNGLYNTSLPADRREEFVQYAATFEINGPYTTALEAKKAGGKKGIVMTDSEIAFWHTYTERVQEDLCRQKLAKLPKIKEYLQNETKYLVHQSLGDWPLYGGAVMAPEKSPFGDNRRWLKGDNKLGKIWMKLRSEL
jgi:predicted NAD-dependent protein-ADP-ribosyltransferase YbiA (DUF1768 family)